MRKYSYEEWGIPLNEYNRLKDAVNQGIMPSFTAEGYMYQIRNALISVDELIRGFNSGKDINSRYTRHRDYINQCEFERIASLVLQHESYVYSYEFFDMGVQVTLYSRSRKSKWNTFLNFNDNGRITGRYKYEGGYDGASLPWDIGNKISRRIRSALYD